MKRVLVSYNDPAAVEPYCGALCLAGVEPVLSPSQAPISSAGVDGVLLTGGVDVNPVRYGEAPVPETETPDDQRDAVELQLISECLSRDLPLFGICRGLQILNVHHGGTLIQHLDTFRRHCVRPADRSLPAHTVEIRPDTSLATIAGTATWQVNSRHHQAVGKLGSNLVVSATDADDGTVEALERSDKRFVLAVQWHPENQALVAPEQRKLFQAFAAAL